MRVYKGHKPKVKWRPRLLASVTLNGVAWELWELREPWSDDWRNLKLVAPDGCEHKANFWLGWSIAEDRLRVCHDGRILRERMPELHDWCVAVMREPEHVVMLYGGEVSAEHVAEMTA